MSSWKNTVLLGGVSLLGLVVGFAVATEDPQRVESWMIGGAFATFGAAMGAMSVLTAPRRQASELPIVQAADGQLLVVPIRRTRVLLIGIYAGILVESLVFGGLWLVSLVRSGWATARLSGGAVIGGCGLALMLGLPRLVRWARSQGSLGWILERRGIALPAGPGVRSIPWDAVTGVDLRDSEVVFRGRSTTITWLTIHTAEASLYNRAKELRQLQDQLGTDVTVCVSVDVLRVRAEEVLHQMRDLLADPAQRQQLGYAGRDQPQICADF